MKLYLKRFIHHVGGLPDFTALRFTRYNQYESMILPMLKYLEEHASSSTSTPGWWTWSSTSGPAASRPAAWCCCGTGQRSTLI